MAELKFLKGLYEEGGKRLEEAQDIGNLSPVKGTVKQLDTLVKLTKDGGVTSNNLKKIDPQFQRDLKVINRQLQRISEVFEQLIGEAGAAQEAVNMDFEGSPGA